MKTLQPINISELLRPYPGKWVALNQSETTVVGVGDSIQIAVEQAKLAGEEHPIVVKSPDQYSAFLL